MQTTRTLGTDAHAPCAAQICEAYGANRYPFPEDPARRRQMMAEVTMRLRELHTTIDAGTNPTPAPHNRCLYRRLRMPLSALLCFSTGGLRPSALEVFLRSRCHVDEHT